ncbi:MAG: hypothetical protein JKX68_08580 [Flavobacteriales bacterium]|nr:hypothetical protein [Flavobacteriales bacterium]
MSFFRDSHIPQHWFITIFGIKVILSILLTIIYTKYYTNRDTADIFKYFDDSLVMFNALKSNPIDYFKMLLGIDYDHSYFTANYYQYMNHWTRPYSNNLISDSHIIIRFNAFVRLFSFGNLQVHNVFINFISLIGLTALFKAFKVVLQNKEKVLFYIVFLIPSVLFWGSGLLKESIIFFGLGLLIQNLFKIISDFKISYLLLIIVGFTLIIYTKLYIIIALLIPCLGYLINRFLQLKKPIYGYIIASILFVMAIYVAPLIDAQLDFISQIAKKQQTFSRFVAEVPTNSGILIPELTDGFSVLATIPNALLNTVIRPFLWECNSLFVWLSAFENLLIITFSIIAVFFRKRIRAAQKNILLFNLIFVFGLFSLIGLTTPVFGAIIRYKIPGLILLLISLLLLVDLEKIKTKHSFLNKIL